MKSLFKRECNLWCDYVLFFLFVFGFWVCLYVVSWIGFVVGGIVELGRYDLYWNYWGLVLLIVV